MAPRKAELGCCNDKSYYNWMMHGWRKIIKGKPTHAQKKEDSKERCKRGLEGIQTNLEKLRETMREIKDGFGVKKAERDD